MRTDRERLASEQRAVVEQADALQRERATLETDAIRVAAEQQRLADELQRLKQDAAVLENDRARVDSERQQLAGGRAAGDSTITGCRRACRLRASAHERGRTTRIEVRSRHRATSSWKEIAEADVTTTELRGIERERQQHVQLRQRAGELETASTHLAQARELITAQQHQIELHKRAIATLQEQASAAEARAASERAAAESQSALSAARAQEASAQLERAQQLERVNHEREVALRNEEERLRQERTVLAAERAKLSSDAASAEAQLAVAAARLQEANHQMERAQQLERALQDREGALREQERTEAGAGHFGYSEVQSRQTVN